MDKKEEVYEGAFGPTAEQARLMTEKMVRHVDNLLSQETMTESQHRTVIRGMDMLMRGAQFDDNRRRLDAGKPTAIMSLEAFTKEIEHLSKGLPDIHMIDVESTRLPIDTDEDD